MDAVMIIFEPQNTRFHFILRRRVNGSENLFSLKTEMPG